MAKPTIANLRREHLERLLGYTPEQGGKFSYNDLVYQYSQMPAFETDDYAGSIVGGFSAHELGSLQATLDDYQRGINPTDTVYSPVASTTFGKTLQDGATGTTRTVTLTGHSLMYGMDTTAAGTNPSVNGSGLTRSAYPTPERFDLMTDYVSPGPVTVVNQAFPGDRTAETITRWSDGTSGDVEFFWIDTNDGLSSDAGPALTDAETADNLLKLVNRARSRGASVVVVGGAPGVDDTGSRKIFASAETDRTIAERLGARYVDAGELLNALPKHLPMFSSGVHFQKEGYNLVGTRLAALMGPKGVNPPAVGPGRIITPRDRLHTIRGTGGTVVARSNAADGLVWSLPSGTTMAIPVEVNVPCVPLYRARVSGTTEGFGVIGAYYATGSSGWTSRFHKITASASQPTAGFVYFTGPALRSPGPDCLMLFARQGTVEIDQVELIPLTLDTWADGDIYHEQRRTTKLDLVPIGGVSLGRSNSSWASSFDLKSGAGITNDPTGVAKVDTRWLFDLTLGPVNCGAVLAASVYGRPAANAWGIAQGFLFIRNGTALIARALDAGAGSDVSFPSVFPSASGIARIVLEINYNTTSNVFDIYVDGTLVGSTGALPWHFYVAGLVAGPATSNGFASGVGSVIQKNSPYL